MDNVRRHIEHCQASTNAALVDLEAAHWALVIAADDALRDALVAEAELEATTEEWESASAEPRIDEDLEGLGVASSAVEVEAAEDKEWAARRMPEAAKA